MNNIIQGTFVFKFEESIFVNNVDVIEDCIELQNEFVQINNIRLNNPELSHFRYWPLFFAIGKYSEDIYAVSWADWVEGRDTGLLAYMYIKQLAPTFDFGTTGTYNSDVWEYASSLPWISNKPLPEWVLRNI